MPIPNSCTKCGWMDCKCPRKRADDMPKDGCYVGARIGDVGGRSGTVVSRDSDTVTIKLDKLPFGTSGRGDSGYAARQAARDAEQAIRQEMVDASTGDDDHDIEEPAHHDADDGAVGPAAEAAARRALIERMLDGDDDLGGPEAA